MEYWNLQHTSRSNRGISLGAQHRIFQSQYREEKAIEEEVKKEDGESKINTKEESSKDESEVSAPPAKKARVESETKDAGDTKSEETTSSKTTTTHSESSSSGVERGVQEDSKPTEPKQSETKQEDEQSSGTSEVRVSSGDEGTKE